MLFSHHIEKTRNNSQFYKYSLILHYFSVCYRHFDSFLLLFFLTDMANELGALELCLAKLDECNDSYALASVGDVISPPIGSQPHCLCALSFYVCLKEIDSFVAKQFGDLYFTSNDRCYRNNFKTLECLEYDDEYLPSNNRCTTYLLDSKSRSHPQWFDLPYYSGKPPKGYQFNTPELDLIRNKLTLTDE